MLTRKAAEKKFKKIAKLYSDGKYQKAYDGLKKIPQQLHDTRTYQVNSAKILAKLSRHDEAIKAYQRAIALANETDDMFHLAKLYTELGKHFDEAATILHDILDMKPDHYQALNQLGLIFHKQQEYEQALAMFKKVLAITAKLPIVYLNMAATYNEMMLYDKAESVCKAGLMVDPNNLPILQSLAINYADQGNYLEAMQYFKQAFTVDEQTKAQSRDLRWYYALMLLKLGDFEHGWKYYQWRFVGTGAGGMRADYAGKFWQSESLYDAVCYIASEQGLGDEVMFGQYLNAVQAIAKKVYLECDDRLAALFARSYPKVEVVGEQCCSGDKPYPDYQFVLPIAHLPYVLQQQKCSVELGKTYLQADPARVGLWQQRLGELPHAFSIAITWAGGKNKKYQQARSLGAQQFANILASLPLNVINVQYKPDAKDMQIFTDILGDKFVTFADLDCFSDIDELAALLSAANLLLSVDNSTVHLAGSLGANVWCMLPFSADWRWGIDKPESTWYESVTLFRQPKLMDWEGLVSQVRLGLEGVVRES